MENEIELELAWLIKCLPIDLDRCRTIDIVQAYINHTDTTIKDARVREKGGVFTYTVKRTKQQFFKDWNGGYFDLKFPEKGQCFWIMVDGKKIGQVNYNKIDLQNKNVELDIILGAKKHTSKGYGTDALKALIKYLFESFDINKVWIGARGNNPRAIKAYQKIGFKKEGLLREHDYFEGKFVDCLRFGILRKEFEKYISKKYEKTI